MIYLERPPCVALAHLVRCYWLVEQAHASAASPQVIFPDGCMELIVHFRVPAASRHGAGPLIDHPGAFVGGQLTRSVEVRPRGPLGMLGVRFWPFGAQPLLGVPMDELAGQSVALDDLPGNDGACLHDQLMDAPDHSHRFRCVEAFLLARARRACAVHPVAREYLARLRQHDVPPRVRDVSRSMGVAPRQLNRVLRRSVGLAAKPLARIVRFQNALRLMRAGRGLRLTDVAHHAGFFDQAHFTREFRDITGLAPGAMLRREETFPGALA